LSARETELVRWCLNTVTPDLNLTDRNSISSALRLVVAAAVQALTLVLTENHLTTQQVFRSFPTISGELAVRIYLESLFSPETGSLPVLRFGQSTVKERRLNYPELKIYGTILNQPRESFDAVVQCKEKIC
jgi:hypothetical protein